MAALPNTERARVWADLMADLSRANEPCGVAKADLLAAVNALDAFVVTNAAAINNAFPVAARAGLTVPQKAKLFAGVVLRRYVVGA